MIETMETRRHATDGDLVRLLDAETTSADAELKAHVAECADCGARLTRLRQRSERLSAALRAADVPSVNAARIRPPFDQASVAHLRAQRRHVGLWMRPAVRAAAALLLLAGVAAASPAARTWIVDQVARLRGSPAPAPAPDRAPQGSGQSPRGSVGAIVWFAPPAGGELIVRFDERPSAGSLELARGNDARAAAQVVARAGSEVLVVLPGELRVRNSPASTADYRLTLPPSVRRVRIHLGAGDVQARVVDVRSGEAQTIPLAGTQGETGRVGLR
jgi:hypothetical protein